MSITQPLTRPLTAALSRAITAPGVGGGGAPTLTAQVQALFAKYSGVGGMWKWDDKSTLFQAAGLATPVTAPGDSVWSVADVSGQGNHLTTGSSSARLLYNGSGVTPDGVNDYFVTAANLDLSTCDKCVTGMGYTKANDTPLIQMEMSASTSSNAGSFYIVSGFDADAYQTVSARGSAASVVGQVAGFASAVANTYGAHIARHSILGAISEVWWNGTKGVDGGADKGTGNFRSDLLYFFSRAGTSVFSNTPARRAIVLGVPVAGTQVSDPDIEIIRQWLDEVEVFP